MKLSREIYPLTQFGKLGKVHSIFDHSVNIKLGKQLINISCFLDYLPSFGLTITEKKFEELVIGLEIGDLINIGEHNIIIYQCNKVITINLRGVEIVDLNLLSFKLSPNNLHELREIFATYPLQELIGIDLTNQTTKDVICLLAASPRRFTNEKARKIVEHLVGRGKGLTPSGDDILMGYISLLQVSSNEKLAELIIALKAQLSATTDISQAYFQSTLLGNCNSYMYQLISDVIHERSALIINNSLKKILNIGHSSGNDLMFGMYLGLLSDDQYGKEEQNGESQNERAC